MMRKSAVPLLVFIVMASGVGCAAQVAPVPVSGTLTIVGATRYPALRPARAVHIVIRGPAPANIRTVVLADSRGTFPIRLAPGRYSAGWRTGGDTTLSVGTFRIVEAGRINPRLTVSLR
ncbi:MAG TPA: hypothetical protein VMW47_13360 [Verrucomicrobiae bacterium]|nr:hypothetical protein [Verrucomicrobiae bacterium]